MGVTVEIEVGEIRKCLGRSTLVPSGVCSRNSSRAEASTITPTRAPAG